jgi:ABC-type Fe3+/spermidine/putrescine transport system ATPase subunit
LTDELPRIIAAFQATTVLVTHRRDEALRLADDLVVLVDGRIQATGEAREVAGSPRVSAVDEVLGYTVLSTAAGRIAVPPSAMQYGSGSPEFSMLVDSVTDLAGLTEIAGHIGDVRVRITGTGPDPKPKQGDRLTVHATHFSEVD